MILARYVARRFLRSFVTITGAFLLILLATALPLYYGWMSMLGLDPEFDFLVPYWITWFLLGGDLYTAYTFVAVPALVFGAGAAGFFAVPYTVVIYPLVFLVVIRLWSVSHVRGFRSAPRARAAPGAPSPPRRRAWFGSSGRPTPSGPRGRESACRLKRRRRRR